MAVAEAPADCDARLRAAALVTGATLLLILWLAWPALAGAAVNTAPPASPVKPIFVHHSTGQAWLDDGHGASASSAKRGGSTILAIVNPPHRGER